MIDKTELEKLMKDAEEKLRAVGIDEARTEVELILEHILSIERLEVYLRGTELIEPKHVEEFRQIIEKRLKRYPLQYILGDLEFYGRVFKVNPDVMVPTHETETLCELAINYAKNENIENPKILDLGVGSGVISVTVAAELPNAEITALDISEGAIAVARVNAEVNGVADRIEFRQSDLFSALTENDKFDLILSNPPYIPDREYDDLPPEVLADPKISLLGGKQGMDIIQYLIDNAPKYLKAHGKLMFEIGYDQSNLVMTYSERNDAYKSINIIKDLNDISRVVILGI
jgi:release factor glutamine methyltransferase